MKARCLSISFFVLLATACTDSGGSGSDDRGNLGKADLIGSCAGADGSDFCGGQSEDSCWCDDLCEGFGDCCADKDATCEGGGFEPCGDKQCGDECNVCPPGDPDCFETEVIKLCNSDGECKPEVPVCDAAFDPCGGKQCGDTCKVCPPDDADCFETAVVKACDLDGACVAETAGMCEIDFCSGCQAGCNSTGCPDGFECVVDPNECIPSACGCDEEALSCICTSDCGGGSCKPL